MSSMLDLIGSFIIGAMLMLMILRVNMNFNEMSTEDRLELMAQENLAELMLEIEFNLRKIGYKVGNPANAIITADTSTIEFWADIDNNGSVDKVKYELSGVNDVPGTMNPRDRILERTVNGNLVRGSLGIVDFQLTLYDATGTVTTNTSLAKYLDYFIQVESPFPIDTVYASASYLGRIHPKNL